MSEWPWPVDDYNDDEYDETPCSVCEVPGETDCHEIVRLKLWVKKDENWKSRARLLQTDGQKQVDTSWAPDEAKSPKSVLGKHHHPLFFNVVM